ncbi:MAG: hypothetical protein IT285_10135 [Bdellovibrionales bacterium]|nr:hypothetical protein [Bdellovibrionales bacterium]
MTPIGAHAGDVYIETGIGFSNISNGQFLFGGLMPASPDAGAAFTLGFWFNLSSDHAPLQFHVGLKDRISTGHSGDLQFILNVPYPMFRLELSRFYFGGGVATWAFTKQGSLAGLGYDSNTGAISYAAEAGVLWKVVPYFHLAVEGAMEYVSPPNATELSPRPAMTFALQMRFFTGLSPTTGEDSKKEYDGWRYPFGIEIGGK